MEPVPAEEFLPPTLKPLKKSFKAGGESGEVPVRDDTSAHIISPFVLHVHHELDTTADETGAYTSRRQPWSAQFSTAACPAIYTGKRVPESVHVKYADDPVALAREIDKQTPYDPGLYAKRDPRRRVTTQMSVARDYECKIPLDGVKAKKIARAVFDFWPSSYAKFLDAFISATYGEGMADYLTTMISGYETLAVSDALNASSWGMYAAVQGTVSVDDNTTERCGDATLTWNKSMQERLQTVSVCSLGQGGGVASRVSARDVLDLLPCLRQHIETLKWMRSNCNGYGTAEKFVLKMLFWINECGRNFCDDLRLVRADGDLDFDRVAVHVPYNLRKTSPSADRTAEMEPELNPSVRSGLSEGPTQVQKVAVSVKPVGAWSGTNMSMFADLAEKAQYAWGFGHCANVLMQAYQKVELAPFQSYRLDAYGDSDVIKTLTLERDEKKESYTYVRTGSWYDAPHTKPTVATPDAPPKKTLRESLNSMTGSDVELAMDGRHYGALNTRGYDTTDALSMDVLPLNPEARPKMAITRPEVMGGKISCVNEDYCPDGTYVSGAVSRTFAGDRDTSKIVIEAKSLFFDIPNELGTTGREILRALKKDAAPDQGAVARKLREYQPTPPLLGFVNLVKYIARVLSSAQVQLKMPDGHMSAVEIIPALSGVIKGIGQAINANNGDMTDVESALLMRDSWDVLSTDLIPFTSSTAVSPSAEAAQKLVSRLLTSTGGLNTNLEEMFNSFVTNTYPGLLDDLMNALQDTTVPLTTGWTRFGSDSPLWRIIMEAQKIPADAMEMRRMYFLAQLPSITKAVTEEFESVGRTLDGAPLLKKIYSFKPMALAESVIKAVTSVLQVLAMPAIEGGAWLVGVSRISEVIAGIGGILDSHTSIHEDFQLPEQYKGIAVVDLYYDKLKGKGQGALAWALRHFYDDSRRMHIEMAAWAKAYDDPKATSWPDLVASTDPLMSAFNANAKKFLAQNKSPADMRAARMGLFLDDGPKYTSGYQFVCQEIGDLGLDILALNMQAQLSKIPIGRLNLTIIRVVIKFFGFAFQTPVIPMMTQLVSDKMGGAELTGISGINLAFSMVDDPINVRIGINVNRALFNLLSLVGHLGQLWGSQMSFGTTLMMWLKTIGYVLNTNDVAVHEWWNSAEMKAIMEPRAKTREELAASGAPGQPVAGVRKAIRAPQPLENDRLGIRLACTPRLAAPAEEDILTVPRAHRGSAFEVDLSDTKYADGHMQTVDLTFDNLNAVDSTLLQISVLRETLAYSLGAGLASMICECTFMNDAGFRELVVTSGSELPFTDGDSEDAQSCKCKDDFFYPLSYDKSICLRGNGRGGAEWFKDDTLQSDPKLLLLHTLMCNMIDNFYKLRNGGPEAQALVAEFEEHVWPNAMSQLRGAKLPAEMPPELHHLQFATGKDLYSMYAPSVASAQEQYEKTKAATEASTDSSKYWQSLFNHNLARYTGVDSIVASLAQNCQRSNAGYRGSGDDERAHRPFVEEMLYRATGKAFEFVSRHALDPKSAADRIGAIIANRFKRPLVLTSRAAESLFLVPANIPVSTDLTEKLRSGSVGRRIDLTDSCKILVFAERQQPRAPIRLMVNNAWYNLLHPNDDFARGTYRADTLVWSDPEPHVFTPISPDTDEDVVHVLSFGDCQQSRGIEMKNASGPVFCHIHPIQVSSAEFKADGELARELQSCAAVVNNDPTRAQLFSMLDAGAILWNARKYFNPADANRPEETELGCCDDVHYWVRYMLEAFIYAREQAKLKHPNNLYETSVKKAPADFFPSSYHGAMCEDTFKRMFPLISPSHSIRQDLRKMRALSIMWGELEGYRMRPNAPRTSGAWMPVSVLHQNKLLREAGLFDETYKVARNPWCGHGKTRGLCAVFNQSYHSAYYTDCYKATHFEEWQQFALRYQRPSNDGKKTYYPFSQCMGSVVTADFTPHRVEKPLPTVEKRWNELVYNRFGNTKPLRIGQQSWTDSGMLQDMYNFEYRASARTAPEQRGLKTDAVYISNFMAYARNHALIGLSCGVIGGRSASAPLDMVTRALYRFHVDSYKSLSASSTTESVPIIVGMVPSDQIGYAGTDHPITCFAGSLPCINTKLQKACRANASLCKSYQVTHLNDAALLCARLHREERKKAVDDFNFIQVKAKRGLSFTRAMYDREQSHCKDAYIEFLQNLCIGMLIESGADLRQVPFDLMEPREIQVSPLAQDENMINTDFLNPRTKDLIKKMDFNGQNITRQQVAIMSLMPPNEAILSTLRIEQKMTIEDLTALRKQIEKETLKANEAYPNKYVADLVQAVWSKNVMAETGAELDPSLADLAWDATRIKDPLKMSAALPKEVTTSGQVAEGAAKMYATSRKGQRDRGPVSITGMNKERYNEVLDEIDRRAREKQRTSYTDLTYEEALRKVTRDHNVPHALIETLVQRYRNGAPSSVI